MTFFFVMCHDIDVILPYLIEPYVQNVYELLYEQIGWIYFSINRSNQFAVASFCTIPYNQIIFIFLKNKF